MVPTVVPPLMANVAVADAVDCSSTVPAPVVPSTVTVPGGAEATVIVTGLVTLLEKPALATVALTAEMPALTLAATPTVTVIVSLTPELQAVVRVQVSVEALQLHRPPESVMATGVTPEGSVTVR
jgi:hypothetical protein